MLSELHVTALAVDAARETLVTHAAGSQKAHAAWSASLRGTVDAVSAACASFDANWEACARTTLHGSIASRLGLQPGGSLADALPRERLRRAHAAAAQGGDALRAKAAELDAALAAVTRDADALFAEGPGCDLAALEARRMSYTAFTGSHNSRAFAPRRRGWLTVQRTLRLPRARRARWRAMP